MKNSKNGSAYITGLIFIFLTSLFVAGILLLTSIEHRNVIRDQWSLTALHLAEAGAEDAIWALKNLYTTTEWEDTDPPWSTGTTYTKTFSSFTDATGTVIGSYYVVITDPTSTTPIIESTGYSPDMDASHSIERTVRVAISESSGKGNVKAAIVTNTDTTTLGALIIDGRDHDLDGNLISGSGTLGIYTTGTYNQGGSSTVGGTSGGTDYPPSSPYDPNVVDSSATWPGGYPTTPDAVMNYTEGTLKSKAQSGSGGSQYVTSPSSLTTPLSGVTYVEYSGTWNAGSFDFTGTGILVVHSPTGNTAVIKNLNTGTFKGLIIADNVEHIHNTIIGAVITLSETVEGNCIGNGNGSILYSSQALAKAFWASGGMELTWQEK